MEKLNKTLEYLNILLNKKNFSISPYDVNKLMYDCLNDVQTTLSTLLKQPTAAINLKIKKLHPLAVTPKYAKSGDAGLDLTCVSVKNEKDYVECSTGLAIEIPIGYVGLVFPRSSISSKDLSLANCVGVIDSGYRGEVTARFRSSGTRTYTPGDRVVQLIVMQYPTVTITEVETLSESERSTGGYGSSGQKG